MTENKEVKVNWNEIIERFPEANFLQSPAYAKMNEILGAKTVVSDFGGLGHALMIIRDAKRGRYLEIPCGPLIDWGDKKAIKKALDSCDSGIVLYIDEFQALDYVQWVEDYSNLSVDRVMEKPQMAVNIYPETGSARVLEMKFTYQNSRDALRSMLEQVKSLLYRIVTDAKNEETQLEMYKSVFAALPREMASTDTSITPAYSLLVHGVGDSKALANVYAAICGRLGLSCITVTGTYQGQPRNWNILQIDGAYFHVDLVRSIESGILRTMTDDQMNGYVWDYSTYPVCSGVPETAAPAGE